MFNSVTVYDMQNVHNGYRVVATNSMNQTVCLTGPKAKRFLMENYFQGYFSSNSLNSGVLPPGVRMVGGNFVVFERPPTYQNIFYNPDKVHSQMDETQVRVYRVALPWQIYIATFTSDYYVSDVRMYFSPVSLSTVSQPMYLPTLPNFYTSGLLCRPFIAGMEDLQRYPKNLSGVIACAYDWIWNNGTNNDLNEAMVHLNLQIVARNGKDNTLFSKMDKEVYNAYFSNPYNIHYYHHEQVSSILHAWEAFTIEDVMNFSWPVPSPDKHFETRYYYQHYQVENVTEHPNYYHWLDSWASDYYEECSSEEIQEMIENGDYDGDEYYEYVVTNHIPVKQIEFSPLTLETILAITTNEFAVPNIKNLVNNFVTNAILIDGMSSDSISTSI